MFPIHTWNVHDSTLLGEVRTNNYSESWNNKFSNLVGYSHPTIWKAIECFRADTASVESILIRMDRGFVPLKKNANLELTLKQD